MNNSHPIGFFDSGVGGTSIWKAVIDRLPNENTIYIADSKYAPYGLMKPEAIIERSIINTNILLEKGAKLIVVACNTATTNAIKELRALYAVPFVGIEPAIKPAALGSKTKKIGILATKGTLSSALFHSTLKLHSSDIECIEVTGTGIVELIEAGKKDSKAMQELLQKLVQPFVMTNIDHLVLGCSHYPFIKEMLQQLLPKAVNIIDSGLAVARQTERILKENQILGNTANPKHQFFTTSKSLDTLKTLTQSLSNNSNSMSYEFI